MIGQPRPSCNDGGDEPRGESDTFSVKDPAGSHVLFCRRHRGADAPGQVTRCGKKRGKRGPDFFLLYAKAIVLRTLSVHCPDMSKNILTPNAAAKVSGVSRSAIMRALANRTLPAQRDNKNRWLISRPDLDAWTGMRPEQDRSTPTTDRAVTEVDQDMFARLAAVQTELASAQAEVAGLRDRLSDAHAERDRLAALLERALEHRPGLLERVVRAFRR